MDRGRAQHDLGWNQDVVDEDDDFPTVEGLVRCTLRKEDLIEEPKDGEHALQRLDLFRSSVVLRGLNTETRTTCKLVSVTAQTI
jgi:hypothetical protein